MASSMGGGPTCSPDGLGTVDETNGERGGREGGESRWLEDGERAPKPDQLA
ncbi:hypothetical protein TIFTF001_019025 [Ficus carica]|uniref:Uncharacterized protein n=1 Tax=Ficus carica TaxID=3494 RepID=A0AA88D8I1_FICCA|nr:hypothetical protein TIFTF001_019025 [Ficus carica]